MQVAILSLANNRLSGTVPYMPSLVMLDMSSNRLTEPRFNAVPASLQLLFLSNNSLTGNMSPIGSLTWSTYRMDFITSYPEFSLLDLSYNNLSGSLPEDMPNLSVLDVSNNKLVGTLPSSWSWRMNRMAKLRLDNNLFTGTLPPSWSEWGIRTDNSLQLSITNTRMHGRMPRQWVQQFCLSEGYKTGDIVIDGAPFTVTLPTNISFQKPLPQIVNFEFQQASINVTLANNTYVFDYNKPDSVLSQG